MFVDTVAFPGYTREILEKAGPFDEELVRNQDDEYNFRIRELGGRILLSPNIRSRYYSRSTFGSLWRQYFQYGYWKVRVLQLHPRQMSIRHFVPAFFIAALAVSGVLSLIWPMAVVAFLLISCSYLLANLLSSAITAIRRRPTAIVLLPAIFAILHFSYGLGFLAGLISFWRRWRR
jgi:hypothetical protein